MPAAAARRYGFTQAEEVLRGLPLVRLTAEQAEVVNASKKRVEQDVQQRLRLAVCAGCDERDADWQCRSVVGGVLRCRSCLKLAAQCVCPRGYFSGR